MALPKTRPTTLLRTGSARTDQAGKGLIGRPKRTTFVKNLRPGLTVSGSDTFVIKETSLKKQLPHM